MRLHTLEAWSPWWVASSQSSSLETSDHSPKVKAMF